MIGSRRQSITLVLIVSVLLVAGVGFVTTAAADTPEAELGSQDVVITDKQAGDQTGSVDIVIDDQRQSTNDNDESSERSGLSTSSVSVTSHSENGVEIEAETVVYENESSGSTEVLVISGLRDESGEIPDTVGDVPITIELTPPEGTAITRNATVTEKGYAVNTFELTESGEYDAEITADVESTTITQNAYFSTGPTAYFYPDLADNLQTGETVEMGVALVNQSTFEPITGASRTVEIQTPEGSISKEFTTDADGVATFEFTPSTSGDYYINDDSLPETAVETYNSYTASNITGATRFSGEYRDNIAPGQVAGIYGQLRSNGETVTNQNINITLTNESTNNIVFSGETQTNEFGQYHLNWTAPDITTEQGYEISIKTPTGTEVAGESFASTIRVEPETSGSDTDTDDGTSRELDVNIVGEEYNWEAVFAPGEQVTAEVTVYENGSTVSDVPVEMRGELGYSGPIIINESTVTDSSGVAEVTFTVPEEVKRTPENEFEMNFYATINGQTVDEGEHARIGTVEYEQDNDYSLSPGDPFNYSVTTTDGAGNPVSDVTTYVFPELNDFHASVVGADAVTTDTDGKVQTTFTTDRSGDLSFGDFGKYNSPSSFPGADVEPYDVEIQSESDLWGEFAPGETVKLSYTDTAADETRATVTVHAGDDDYQRVSKDLLYIDQLSSSENATFTIPEDTPTGVDYEVTVSTATKPGTRVVEDAWLDVTSDNTAPTAAFSYGPTPTTVGSDITFDATNSTDADGSISSYEWDLDGDGNIEATGETPTFAPDSGGIYDVTLTVTDNEGVTDSVTKTLTVAPAIEAPSDAIYDPTEDFTVGTGHDAVGIIDSSDVAVRLVNVTNGNNTVVATNDSVPQIGHANTTIPAGSLSGDVTIETQLYNSSNDTIEATASVHLTAAVAGGGGAGGGGGPLVFEDTVSLSGSVVTVNTSGENAIAVENLPENATISDISDSGSFNSDERSILYQDLSDEGLPANVTFKVNPNESVYGPGDTITFSVNNTQVNLAIATVPEELQGDVTGAQYAAVVDDSSELSASNLAEAINGWADNGKVNGVEIGALELSKLINHWADN